VTYPEARVIQGDCLQSLRSLPDESVHCVVTSPPYYGLRSYGTEPLIWGGDPYCPHDWQAQRYYREGGGGTSSAQAFSEPGEESARRLKEARWHEDAHCDCGAWRGDLGLEPTVEMWIENLVTIFRECRRVLRRDGTCWVNVGDAYACAPNGNSAASYKGKDDRAFRDKPMNTVTRKSWRQDGAEVMAGAHHSSPGFKAKDLMLLPHRLAIALQQDGWWVRQAITWCKPSAMPESVTDRCTSATEMLFMLTRSEHYFYDATAIRERSVDPPGVSRGGSLSRFGRDEQLISGNGHRGEKEYSSSGCRNKRNWWVIPGEAYPAAHFATFPRALVRPCVLAGTSAEGCCSACLAPFVRQVDARSVPTRTPRTNKYQNGNGHQRNDVDVVRERRVREAETTGWAPSCSCPEAPAVPCTVLDCFAGSGTVGEVALSLGRSAVLLELSHEYVKLIERRISRAQVPLPLGL
jgi:DNA modification methylase